MTALGRNEVMVIVRRGMQKNQHWALPSILIGRGPRAGLDKQHAVILDVSRRAVQGVPP
jgi:hypothetical protein